MELQVLESTVSDNFFYLLEGNTACVLIDPVDASTAIAAVEACKKPLLAVFNTHWHPDHTAGNDAVLDRFPDAKLVSGPDAPLITCDHEIDEVLEPGSHFVFDDVAMKVLSVPGHTHGHVALLKDDILISGDVIFVAGAGHCRTGDPGQLFRTYRDVLGPLDDTTRFFPGHDYSKRNTEFALSLEPDLEAAREFLASLDGQNAPVLTTLGDERRYNPFFRFGSPDLQNALKTAHATLWNEQRAMSESDDEATFRTTRALRNSW